MTFLHLNKPAVGKCLLKNYLFLNKEKHIIIKSPQSLDTIQQITTLQVNNVHSVQKNLVRNVQASFFPLMEDQYFHLTKNKFYLPLEQSKPQIPKVYHSQNILFLHLIKNTITHLPTFHIVCLCNSIICHVQLGN